MNQGELVLVKFPFSDLSAVKARPSLIVSNDKYNISGQDVLLCAATSNPAEYEYGVKIGPADMVRGKLRAPSTIKADKLMLMDKARIIKLLGKISEEKFAQTVQKINGLISSKEGGQKPGL